MERTLVMVKPDGVQRRLVGEVLSRLENKGLRMVGLKLLLISPELARVHYEAHRDKPFFPELITYITSGPVVAMVWEGPGAVAQVRNLMGPTNPSDAPPGTIRGDYAVDITNNIVHGSDSKGAAEREIQLFFGPDELLAGE